MGTDGQRPGASGSKDFDPEKHYLSIDRQSDSVWKQIFKSEAFTSLTIADFVLAKTNTSFRDYLTKPKELKDKIDTQVLSLYSDLDVLYKGPGRCATFAVKVCKKLEADYSDQYDFKYFNIGQHRIARCAKSKVLIDSSSDCGSFKLKHDNSWMWWEGCVQKWEYTSADKKMHYQKKTGVPISVSGEITWNEAVALSANQFSTQKQPVLATLFRNILYRDINEFAELQTPGMTTVFRTGLTHGEIEYMAMLRWDVNKKCLECWPSLRQGDQCLVIYWGKNGTDAQSEECLRKVEDFVEVFGIPGQWGATSRHQPRSLYEIHMDVWTAATGLWGNPIWKENVNLIKK